MVESEGADAVELVNGEVFTSGPRVDPLPSAGAGQVELHDGARVRPRPVLVCGVQPVLRRAVRMSEGSSVDATELPLGQRMGGAEEEAPIFFSNLPSRHPSLSLNEEIKTARCTRPPALSAQLNLACYPQRGWLRVKGRGRAHTRDTPGHTIF